MIRSRRVLFAAALLVSIMLTSSLMTGVTHTSATTGGTSSQDLPNGNLRQVPMDIKIVFVGIGQTYVNITDGYLGWNLIPYHIQRETWFGTNWGVNYTYEYSYVFNQTFDNDFFNYLHFGPGVRKDAVLTNPYNGLNGWYRFYNANKVEDWLYNNPQGYGGIPQPGYVLFLINLTYRDAYISPVRNHYYNLTYSDIDSGGIVTGDWYGQWMTGWGGHYRLYYIDVSAGAAPAAVNAWGPGQQWWNHYFPPLWGLPINLGTKNGINFLNEYLSDFVFGATYGDFTEDFLYPPRIAPGMHYNITIIIFDNCTGYYSQTLEGGLPPYGLDFAVTQASIKEAFQELIPYAIWSVNVTYVHLNGTADPAPYSDLWSTIRNAERTLDAFGNPVTYVDREQLYHYLQTNLVSLVTPKAGQLLIPVFVFAFKGTYNLGYEYEGYEYDNYWGFGYPDVVLVSHSIHDLTGAPPPPPPVTPQGFTQTIIHEVGHTVGLIHPFWWDYDEDFVASAMAYYPYEYRFSQFDKDAIQRGHADYYIIKAQSLMEIATQLKQWKTMNSSLLKLYEKASGNITLALSFYDAMNYPNAMSSGKTSFDLLALFIAGAEQQSQVAPAQSSTLMVVVAAMGGLVAGIVLGLYIKSRRK